MKPLEKLRTPNGEMEALSFKFPKDSSKQWKPQACSDTLVYKENSQL